MYSRVHPHMLGFALEARDRLEKRAVADVSMLMGGGQDPSMMGGGGQDPAAMMGGGQDPAAMGQPPPADAAAAAAPAMGQNEIQAMIQSTVQAMMPQMAGGGMGGGAAGGGAPKMKMDPNEIMLRILKLLALICDYLKIPVPAADMVVTPGDIMQQASGQATQPQQQQPQPQQGGQGAIGPIQALGGVNKAAAAVDFRGVSSFANAISRPGKAAA